MVGKLLSSLAPEMNLVAVRFKETMLKGLVCNFQVSRDVCQDWESHHKDYQYLKVSFYMWALSGNFFQEQ